MPAPPLGASLLKADDKDFPWRAPAAALRRNQLARRASFPDQFDVGQLAEVRADRRQVDVLVAVFPRIVHLGIVARGPMLWVGKRFADAASAKID
jgi:hypothetical protein